MKKLIILILPIILLSCQKEKDMDYPFDGTYWSDINQKDRVLVIAYHKCTVTHYDMDGNAWFTEPFGTIEGNTLIQASITYSVQNNGNTLVFTQNGNPTNQLFYYRK